jgi:hypothetical protein
MTGDEPLASKDVDKEFGNMDDEEEVVVDQPAGEIIFPSLYYIALHCVSAALWYAVIVCISITFTIGGHCIILLSVLSRSFIFSLFFLVEYDRVGNHFLALFD